MWQSLLPFLADKYHLIGPDYPGFDNSSAPSPSEVQPPTLVVWGKYDPSFMIAGATAYADDVPKAEIHLLEAGHFALDKATDEIASLVRGFLDRLNGLGANSAEA
jgi:pimeloyl-ACP methyl ester carboxylesterase